MARKVLAAAVGECIHIIGVRNFLEIAQRMGLETVYLGAAVPAEELTRAVASQSPEIVGVGYRLSSTSCRAVLDVLREQLDAAGLLAGRIYLFGGTRATGDVAREAGWFDTVFDGTESREDVFDTLRRLCGEPASGEHNEGTIRAEGLVARLRSRGSLPIIRHHIGLSTVEATEAAVRDLASSGLVDVISIAPDQMAQEAFFRPAERQGVRAGAGGVPLRRREELERLYAASRCGAQPLCRCYSGTNDVFEWAEMLLDTIRNAWCAVPLSWYNRMDRRGPRPLATSLVEAQRLMRWHAERGVPVEVNEAHQWSLRRAPDAVAVAAAYLAAYNAKRAGVRHYVSQIMLGTPAGIAPARDLAKALAICRFVEELHDDRFTSFRELRPGLLSYPAEFEAARGQLAFSTLCAMHLRPEIFHTVAYTEGVQAAGPEEILGSVRLVRRVMRSVTAGFPVDAVLQDEMVRAHASWLRSEADAVLDAIRRLGRGVDDPLADAGTLVRAIEIGILDAPDLEGAEGGRGIVSTAICDGACVAVEPATGRRISEAERVERLLEQPWGGV